MIQLPPLVLERKLDSRIWGGATLGAWLGLANPPAQLAESWQVYDQNTIVGGPLAGQTLLEATRQHGAALVGAHSFARYGADFPLLAKFIDAADDLSVQVHPDDSYALAEAADRGYPGKTEMYYIIAADPGAGVYFNLRPGVRLEQFRQTVERGESVRELLNFVPVRAGDVLYSPSRLIHAIGKGVVYCEIQQNSDITYRMYDYGRGRELHIEKSIESTRLTTKAGKVSPRVLPDRTILIETDFFAVEKIPVEVSRSSTTLTSTSESGPALSYLFAASGSARITSPSFESLDLPERGIVAIPASSPIFAIEDLGGLDLIRIAVRTTGR